MLVTKFFGFWPWAIFSRFSNFQNYYFIDLWLGSWRLRGRKNVSVGHETSIPSIEKVSASSFSSRGLFFSSIWTVQPRSDCPASASGLGWTTVRPWLDSRPWLDTPPDLRKWKFSHDKETSLLSFVTFWASLQRQHRTFILSWERKVFIENCDMNGKVYFRPKFSLLNILPF